MTDQRLWVKLVSGMPDEVNAWAETPCNATVDITNGVLTVRDDAVFNPNTADFGINSLRFISYEDAGTKSNVAALATFGSLGLGARRPWTLITIGFEHSDAQILVREPVYRVRDILQRAATSSPALGPLLLEGPPPTHPTGIATEANAMSSLDELERLASLYERNLITDDEYATMKAKLISGS